MNYGDNQPFSVKNANQDEGALFGGKLVPGGGTLKVQNSSSREIPGIDSVLLEVHDGKTYSYKVVVQGACPKGKTDNKLEFTDAKSDSYTLRIYDETPGDIPFGSTGPIRPSPK